MDPRLRYNLVIVHPIHGVIGSCGINVESLENRITSISYFINKCFWGKGYGTEIVSRLISYGFEDLNMTRITATYDPRHNASWKVMESGMKREGFLRHDRFIRGDWRDTCICSILLPEHVRDS